MEDQSQDPPVFAPSFRPALRISLESPKLFLAEDPLPSNTASTPTPTTQKDAAYYLEFLTFLVEDCLYKVPKYQFRKSTVLCEIIASGAKNEDTPVVLQDVTKGEFSTLLELMYPISDPLQHRDFSHGDWAVILKLASQWMFSELRKLAITSLSSHSWMVKVPLARAYGAREWLYSAYTDLASRGTSLTIDEARVLGLDATVILFAIREEPLQRNRHEYKRGRESKGQNDPYENGVDEEFKDLESHKGDEVRNILMAKQPGVPAEWLRTAYIRLVKRRRGIWLVEAKKLGLETTVRVCRARENALGTYPREYRSSNLSIEKEFEVELQCVAMNEANYDRQLLGWRMPAPETLVI
ncbi:hypothetical protein H0H81_004074 [Sphagnurus paluster]|uniref:BTB domain-containing protein n=1 Tax=Sphagnurus paluster TaxID=117069 RepID=A0A9P7GL77_9AGAR|nr:hypothetical protein H0H81_004074 [Sphagnurus paluster]